MKQTLSIIALFAAVPALAQDSRELGAHEHGVGTLNIAIDGNSVAMEFEAPGADIVGFEYEAQSDVDLAAIDAALEKLVAPLDLFVLPMITMITLTTTITMTMTITMIMTTTMTTMIMTTTMITMTMTTTMTMTITTIMQMKRATLNFMRNTCCPVMSPMR